jgi:hypothetical protein
VKTYRDSAATVPHVYLTLNRSILWLLLLPVTLAATGCSGFATYESTQFQPAIPDVDFTERQTASATTTPVSKLRQQGYFELGRIRAEQFKRQCDDSTGKNCEEITHEITTKEQALQEAAKLGGDIVTFSQVNALKQETRFRNGSCLSSRQETQLVSQPTYSYECRQVGNNTECTNRQTGSTMVPQTVTVCTSYEKIPYLVDVEQSKGLVWRKDKKNAAKFSQLVDYSKSAASDTNQEKSSVGPGNEDMKTLSWIVGGILGFAALVFSSF